MRIVMRTTSAGPEGTRWAGGTYDLPEDEAKDLLASGSAVPAERSTRAAAAETASTPTEGAETAASTATPSTPRTGPGKRQNRT